MTQRVGPPWAPSEGVKSLNQEHVHLFNQLLLLSWVWAPPMRRTQFKPSDVIYIIQSRLLLKIIKSHVLHENFSLLSNDAFSWLHPVPCCTLNILLSSDFMFCHTWINPLFYFILLCRPGHLFPTFDIVILILKVRSHQKRSDFLRRPKRVSLLAQPFAVLTP